MINSLGNHALRVLTAQSAITIDRSRCVRHRCNRNECSNCMDNCPVGAIVWNESGLQVKSTNCTKCLSCLSVCPTASLQLPELALHQLLSDLATHPHPVLGCQRQSYEEAHAKLSCLGYLAHPELMLLLALVFKGGLQLNLCKCHDCPNSHILGGVHETHARLQKLIPRHKILLVGNRKALAFRPKAMTRRELFSLFRDHSKRTAAVMVERLHPGDNEHSYGSKQLPMIRAMLLKAMETRPDSQRHRIAGNLFGNISFTPSCTACGGCVGVCPTGAIQPAEEGKEGPVFERRLCVDCGSCQVFCSKNGIQKEIVLAKEHLSRV